MKQKINEYDFTRAFAQSDTYKDQFSYGALKTIFAYYEELEESTGEELELDIVATCCEFTEYASAWEAMEQYQPEDLPVFAEEEDENGQGFDLLEIAAKQEEMAREWLEERTTVLDAVNIGSELKEITSIVIVQF